MQSCNVVYTNTQTYRLIALLFLASISPNSATSAVSDVISSEASHVRHRLTHAAIRPTRRNLQTGLLCSNFTQSKTHQSHATCNPSAFVKGLGAFVRSLDRSHLTHARNSTNHVLRMPIVRGGSAGSPARCWRNPSAVSQPTWDNEP
jgi:hypothetical protein